MITIAKKNQYLIFFTFVIVTIIGVVVTVWSYNFYSINNSPPIELVDYSNPVPTQNSAVLTSSNNTQSAISSLQTTIERSKLATDLKQLDQTLEKTNEITSSDTKNSQQHIDNLISQIDSRLSNSGFSQTTIKPSHNTQSQRSLLLKQQQQTEQLNQQLEKLQATLSSK